MAKSKKMLSYDGKNGTMHYFNVIVGKDEIIYHIRCYQKHKMSSVREGLTYKFSNVIKKADTYWVVQSSCMSIVPPVQCDVMGCTLPEDEPMVGQKRSIEQALSSPQKSTVRAKIVKVSPVSMKCEGTLPVRCLGIKDNSGMAKVALFQTMAQEEFVEDSVIEISGLYKKLYNGKEQLVASHISECQFLGNDNVQVDITPEDTAFFEGDFDFGQQQQAKKTDEALMVISLIEAFIYEACDYEGCYKKKMKDGICPTCSGLSFKKTSRAKLEIQAEDGKSFNTVVFEKDLITLFGAMDYNLYPEGIDLLVSLSYQLPVEFRGHVTSGRLLNVKKN